MRHVPLSLMLWSLYLNSSTAVALHLGLGLLTIVTAAVADNTVVTFSLVSERVILFRIVRLRTRSGCFRPSYQVYLVHHDIGLIPGLHL